MMTQLVMENRCDVLASERRMALRHKPWITEARVAWRHRGLRFEKTRVALLDISTGGARVLTPVYPRVGRALCIGLTGLPHEWVRAEVLSSELVGNQWACSLKFSEPCPPGMLEMALMGNLLFQ